MSSRDFVINIVILIQILIMFFALNFDRKFIAACILLYGLVITIIYF